MARPIDDFPHPYVAVDVLLLVMRRGRLHVAVIERADEDPLGWALPGAFVDAEEDVETTAGRVVAEKLGFDGVPELLPMRPFGAVDRDPRRRTITLPYAAPVPESIGTRAQWANVALAAIEPGNPPATSVHGEPVVLCFDHQDILGVTLAELGRRARLDDTSIHRALLPDRFTLRDLQQVHEALIAEELNTDSFRRRVKQQGWLEPTGERETDVEHRPAELWRWRA